MPAGTAAAISAAGPLPRRRRDGAGRSGESEAAVDRAHWPGRASARRPALDVLGALTSSPLRIQLSAGTSPLPAPPRPLRHTPRQQTPAFSIHPGEPSHGAMTHGSRSRASLARTRARCRSATTARYRAISAGQAGWVRLTSARRDRRTTAQKSRRWTARSDLLDLKASYVRTAGAPVHRRAREACSALCGATLGRAPAVSCRVPYGAPPRGRPPCCPLDCRASGRGCRHFATMPWLIECSAAGRGEHQS